MASCLRIGYTFIRATILIYCKLYKDKMFFTKTTNRLFLVWVCFFCLFVHQIEKGVVHSLLCRVVRAEMSVLGSRAMLY